MGIDFCKSRLRHYIFLLTLLKKANMRALPLTDLMHLVSPLLQIFHQFVKLNALALFLKDIRILICLIICPLLIKARPFFDQILFFFYHGIYVGLFVVFEGVPSLVASRFLSRYFLYYRRWKVSRIDGSGRGGRYQFRWIRLHGSGGGA